MRERTEAGRRMSWTALVYVLLPLGLAATLRHVDFVDGATPLSASVLPVPALPLSPASDPVVLEGVELLAGPPAHLSASVGAGGPGGWLVRGLSTPGVEAGFQRIGRRPGTRGFLGRLNP